MKIKKYIVLLMAIVIISVLCTTATYAITEKEVKNAIADYGREAVSGNVLVWFMCAVAFLKIAQKLESILGSLGINVGQTGGSLMAELMIASRAISAGRKALGGGASASGGANSANGSSGGFMSGGLAGIVSKPFNKGAMQNATGESGGGIGGKIFESSMEKGGDFANNIIGSIAKGKITSNGTMHGENAVKAFNSYMGHTAQQISFENTGGTPPDIPAVSDIEIGGGRIMGKEISADNPDGIQFGMYNTEQYMTPEGQYSTVDAADGSKWYKQYAQDAVDKTPYMAPDGSIAYNEALIKKLPDMPRRKERV
jgi:hypothetical protein